MRIPHGFTAFLTAGAAALCVLLGTAAVVGGAARQAQEGAAKPEAASMPPPQGVDPYDRNAMLWAMERVGRSPVERGQEIYYMRCWICHNEYTIAAEGNPAYAAPSLRDLFKRPRLRNGRPVTDETVTAQIRSGGPQMPAYSPANLNDKDVADLLAYLKEKCGTFARGSGCFDEHNPPLNPRYRAQ